VDRGFGGRDISFLYESAVLYGGVIGTNDKAGRGRRSSASDVSYQVTK